jgi:hypothetical protein
VDTTWTRTPQIHQPPGKKLLLRTPGDTALRFLPEEAVISEPISARWFPVPREITGKFADFGLEIAKGALAFGRKFNRF